MMMMLEPRMFGYAVARVLQAEYEVLQAIDFNVVVFDVYSELRPLLVSCRLVDGTQPFAAELERSPAAAAAWSAANDSYLLTDALLLFPPHVVAMACVVLGACVMHQVDLRWWFATLTKRQGLEADMRHVWEVVSVMLDGYQLWCTPDWAARAQTALSKLKISRPEPPRP